MPLSEARVDEAARTLAIESRALLGLPTISSASHWIETLPSPPSALDFLRIISRHKPVLIEKCLKDCTGLDNWKQSTYLVKKLQSRKLEISLTPDGRADDVHSGPEGKGVFALPLTIELTLDELLLRLKSDTTIAYLQSQNSNLTDKAAGDLSPLLEDLKMKMVNGEERFSLVWADEALGRLPEATNLWIGTEKSRTSMHRDHYENLFSVIRGTKIFTLYPPSEAHFLCDDELYQVYQWTSKDEIEWKLQPFDAPPTPWIPIDPTEPFDSERNCRYPRFSQALPPLIVEVYEGQTLYLPAGWYHHVAQRGDHREDICISVNWWYESEFAFSDRWALEAFVKEIGQAARQKKDQVNENLEL